MSYRTRKSGSQPGVFKCPCGSSAGYADCCGALHGGQAAPAHSPELTMRSRYSAFVLGLADYLRASWVPQHRPPAHWSPETGIKWLGLKVIGSTISPDGRHGTVEFIARSRIDGKGHRHHETSRFERCGEHWLYIDGDVH